MAAPKTDAAAEAPAGEAMGIDLGALVVNTTNGKAEFFQGPQIVFGLSSGNVRSMLAAKKELELKFAQQSELTTDASSPDDEAVAE